MGVHGELCILKVCRLSGICYGSKICRWQGHGHGLNVHSAVLSVERCARWTFDFYKLVIFSSPFCEGLKNGDNTHPSQSLQLWVQKGFSLGVEWGGRGASWPGLQYFNLWQFIRALKLSSGLLPECILTCEMWLWQLRVVMGHWWWTWAYCMSRALVVRS